MGAKAPETMSALTMLEIIRTRLANCGRRLATAGAVRRLVRQQDGAVAVEFGLVAAPVLALVFAIMETAVGFFFWGGLPTPGARSCPLVIDRQAHKRRV